MSRSTGPAAASSLLLVSVLLLTQTGCGPKKGPLRSGITLDYRVMDSMTLRCRFRAFSGRVGVRWGGAEMAVSAVSAPECFRAESCFRESARIPSPPAIPEQTAPISRIRALAPVARLRNNAAFRARPRRFRALTAPGAPARRVEGKERRRAGTSVPGTGTEASASCRAGDSHRWRSQGGQAGSDRGSTTR